MLTNGGKMRIINIVVRTETTKCGCSSSGRAPPCQGGGSEFEPRHPLHVSSRENRLLFSFFVQWFQLIRKICGSTPSVFVLRTNPPPSKREAFLCGSFHCYLLRQNGRYDVKAPSEEGAVTEGDWGSSSYFSFSCSGFNWYEKAAFQHPMFVLCVSIVSWKSIKKLSRTSGCLSGSGESAVERG